MKKTKNLSALLEKSKDTKERIPSFVIIKDKSSRERKKIPRQKLLRKLFYCVNFFISFYLSDSFVTVKFILEILEIIQLIRTIHSI